MTWNFKKSRLALWLAGGVVGWQALAGTAAGQNPKFYKLHNCYWPQPYIEATRMAVREPFVIQAQNGLMLEQTIWNYHFEYGTDRLHPSCVAFLDRMSRRPAEPVLQLFLQTARDIRFFAERPKDYKKDQADLNTRRIKAVMA